MVPQLTVRLDRIKVAQAGLSSADVNDWVEIAVGGKAVTQVYDGETRMDVIVRADSQYRQSIEDIRGLPVPVPGGGKIRLDQISQVAMVDSPQAVFRENGYRRIGVKFSVEGRDLGSAMKEILSKAKDLKQESGYFVEWGGEYENQKRAMARLLVVLPATALLLGVILFLLFENLKFVGAILATLVIASVGSVVLLYLRGIPFSVSSAVGLLALSGVVTLNNVTITSAFIRLQSANPEGAPRKLVRTACHEQFRSLLMTSLLAALGLLPAAISHGIGSETQRPLATAVIGGLVTGLPAVLYFLPVMLIGDLKASKAWTIQFGAGLVARIRRAASSS